MTAFLRAATRSSPLARWQTDHVATLLRFAHPELHVDPVIVDTLGDRTQALGTPLHQLGGQGVFVKEVQAAVLRGDADIAVHSAKDLPSRTAEGLVLAAIPARGDVRDVLIGSTLDALPKGATIGTSSVRRIAQLRSTRPDLRFTTIRGNVGTRVSRVGELDAVIVAAAGVERLGLLPAIAARHVIEWLPVDIMVPMVAQGALAIECRADDARTTELLAAITHSPTESCVVAERSFLATLGGGCDLPVGALAGISGDDVDELTLTGLIAAEDGTTIVRRTDRSAVVDAVSLGHRVATSVLDDGGRALLTTR